MRKGGRFGPGDEDDKEGHLLNRVVRWTNGGLEYEADPRRIERLSDSHGFDDSRKSVVTPGMKLTKEQMAEEKLLEGK